MSIVVVFLPLRFAFSPLPPLPRVLMVGFVLYSFAYVDFATPDAKLAAITLSERNLEGRRLLIKDGVYLQAGLPLSLLT